MSANKSKTKIIILLLAIFISLIVAAFALGFYFPHHPSTVNYTIIGIIGVVAVVFPIALAAWILRDVKSTTARPGSYGTSSPLFQIIASGLLAISTVAMLVSLVAVGGNPMVQIGRAHV